MTDPLDTLHRPIGSTEPDPDFRAALMARLADELASSPRSTTDPSSSTDEFTNPWRSTCSSPTPLSPARTDRWSSQCWRPLPRSSWSAASCC